MMMSSLTKRYNATTNWRQVKHYPSVTLSDDDSNTGGRASFKGRFPKSSHLFGSNFILALLITIVIILVQLFIVHHYLGSHKRHALLSRHDSSEESFLLKSPDWLCHSYSHLNKVAELASKHQVELVIVDEDLLETLLGGETLEKGLVVGKKFPDLGSIQFSSKTKQEASQKSIIHLVAINETSGGQPSFVSFHDDLKNYYHMLKYDDTSETMAPEVYRRQAHQLDDVQSDAMRDSSSGKHSELMRQQMDDMYEISKIYTEFMAHLFLLNTTSMGASNVKTNKLCSQHASGNSDRQPFIVIHLFVLYNYEHRPQEEWIQSGLTLDELERHKLLAYGVHSIDFKIPLNHNYIHTKRDTLSLINTQGSLAYNLKPETPIAQLSVFKPPGRLLTYANNTYLHCKPSQFNISGLIDGNRKLNEYLRTLDASKPPSSNEQRAMMSEQLSIAIQFMDVFSKTYSKFSFWLTGSSLLSYHKFCHLTASPDETPGYDDSNDSLLLYDDEYDYGTRPRNRAMDNKNKMLDLEIGLFASEVNPNMLEDLSKARMIGVTMISNWRKSNSRVSFHVKDCPNVLFSLHFYELKKDFYQHFYVTNDIMIHKHKFRRKKSVKLNKSVTHSGYPITYEGHHVFKTSNVELCWTRLDNIHPFRVPCDVHDHLRRIYVI